MKRREFLSLGALAGDGIISGEARAAAKKPKVSASGQVKFCVFADIHYKPGVWGFPNSKKEWLGKILERAKREKCDFVIHCGDMCHNPPEVKDYIDYYNDFEIPTYHTIGNHETDGCSYEDVLKTFRLEKGNYFFDRNGFRFIVVDTNYFYRKSIKGFVHFGKGVKEEGDAWGRIPDEQYEWIEKTISDSPYPCVTFSHLSFERASGNRRMQEIFAKANAAMPGKVRMSINGHYHTDYLRVLDDVLYFDVNSASYQWIGSKRAHKFYPAEYFEKIGQGGNVRKVPWIAYESPLSAIVTMKADGEVRIEGTESSFACGVTPKKVGMEVDYHSRASTARIQSAKLKMFYGNERS
jgi:predicted phosphodiesterase